MSVLDSIKTFFGFSAASALPVVAPPKVKPGPKGWPAFFQNTKPSATAFSRTDRNLATTDIAASARGKKTDQMLEDFVSASPELGAAVNSALRVGIPEKYSAIARNVDGSFNGEATNLLQQLLTRIDVIGDYSNGFSSTQSLKSTSESLARELMLRGACAMELVLDKGRLPAFFQPIATGSIEFLPDVGKGGNGVRPVQKVGGDTIDLDIPTFFWVSLDQPLSSPYPNSPIESVLQAVLLKESFIADLRRVIKRVAFPRQKVTVDEERVRKHLSPEAQLDPEKATEELNGIIAGIETKLANLNPEDALVYLDSLGFSIEAGGATGLSDEYKVLTDISNSRIASAAKTLPSVLGLSAGAASSNISSTECQLYLMSIDGAIRQKLNEIYSRALTLALRLFGLDVVVTFRYATIDLRPASELEAFYQTRQTRILEQLSLGLISDEEASLELTGKLPPAGYVPKSGTMFKSAGGGQASMGPQTPSNDGSTLNQNLKPDTPSQGRGQNRRAALEVV